MPWMLGKGGESAKVEEVPSPRCTIPLSSKGDRRRGKGERFTVRYFLSVQRKEGKTREEKGVSGYFFVISPPCASAPGLADFCSGGRCRLRRGRIPFSSSSGNSVGRSLEN